MGALEDLVRSTELRGVRNWSKAMEGVGAKIPPGAVNVFTEDSPLKQTVRGAAGTMVSGAAVPIAALIDLYRNAQKAPIKAGMGIVGAVAGLNPPETPGYNFDTTRDVADFGKGSLSTLATGIKGIGSGIREGLKGVGFTEPKPPVTATTATATPAPAATPKVSTNPETINKTVVSPPPIAQAGVKGNATPKVVEGNYGVKNVTPEIKETGNVLDNNTFVSINPNRQPIGVEAATGVSTAATAGGQDNLPPWDRKNVTNPFDDKASELADMLLETAGNMRSESNPLKQKYNILALKALQDALVGVTPSTSRGAFGIEGMRNIIAQGKLGIEEGELGVKRGALDLAKTKEGREAEESKSKGEYYKANAEESRAKAKYYGNLDNPTKLEAQAQSAWLKGWDDYMKNDLVLQDLIGKTPEERDAAIESHQQLYRKLNPPPVIRKVENPDGTVSVTFADGTVQKMRKKGAK